MDQNHLYENLRNPNPKIPKLRKTDCDECEERKSAEHDHKKFLKFIWRLTMFIIQLTVVYGMLYYSSNDSNALKYREGLASLFNCDPNSQKLESPMPFLNIKKPADFWIWAQKDLADAILASHSHGKPTFNLKAYFNDKNSRSMGVGIVRQIRSLNLYKKCESKNFTYCIDLNALEDTTSAYSNGWENVINSSEAEYAYIYRRPKGLNGMHSHRTESD
uniref:Polycystin domain-containing protein n=1 Tax=Panagrolaimus davidi TaxID=227884 RepID=A0A914Q166_9BILA